MSVEENGREKCWQKKKQKNLRHVWGGFQKRLKVCQKSKLANGPPTESGPRAIKTAGLGKRENLRLGPDSETP